MSVLQGFVYFLRCGEFLKLLNSVSTDEYLGRLSLERIIFSEREFKKMLQD